MRLKTFFVTGRERLKSALYPRLKKRKVFKTCPGRIFEKLRKQFRVTQKVPFMLGKNRKPLFPQLGTKNMFFEKTRFFSFGKGHTLAKYVKGGPLGFINMHSVAKYKKTRRRNPLET